MADTRDLHGGHAEQDCTGCTMRSDSWWAGPTAVLAGLLLFIVYSTAMAMQGEHYFYKNYISPMYSPVVYTEMGPNNSPERNAELEKQGHAPANHSMLGQKPDVWPAGLPFSPAFLILAFPGAFRFTCYYYRKAYYRSFWANPAGCAVGPFRRGKYRGETALLLFQNLHRYALYFALLFLVFLWYDAGLAFFRDGKFGLGGGSIVLTLNAFLLSCYTLGCHSFRHLVGGRLNWFSKSAFAHFLWSKSTVLNERHQLFAWCSLFWVGFSDFYVRMVSMGFITDPSTWS